jgi:hypothetical protein
MQKCAADQGQRQRAGQRRRHRAAPHQRPPATCLLARQRGTPGRSHSGSGWTSPAAGYTLQARHQGEPLGGYEPAGRPVMDQHAKSGYGSPLDLPRTDYSNASELSTGADLSFSLVALRMHGTA